MSPERTPFIAGNWKMNKTIAEAEQFISALLPKVSSVDGVEVAICVPFLALQAMVDSARGSRVQVFAQTMHDADEGAFTGEVPILYGGSVTAANIGEFLAEPSIDGALVGGASLKPDEMAGIVARAGLTAAARSGRVAG